MEDIAIKFMVAGMSGLIYAGIGVIGAMTKEKEAFVFDPLKTLKTAIAASLMVVATLSGIVPVEFHADIAGYLGMTGGIVLLGKIGKTVENLIKT